jgi:hypothetical protein
VADRTHTPRPAPLTAPAARTPCPAPQGEEFIAALRSLGLKFDWCGVEMRQSNVKAGIVITEGEYKGRRWSATRTLPRSLHSAQCCVACHCRAFVEFHPSVMDLAGWTVAMWTAEQRNAKVRACAAVEP